MPVQVTIPGEDTPRERAFAIRIKWAATVDIKAIVDFVRCAYALDAGAVPEQATRMVSCHEGDSDASASS